MKRNKLALLAAAILVFSALVLAQIANQATGTVAAPLGSDSTGTRSVLYGDTVTFTPAQLGMSAVTLPASNVSSDTLLINTAHVGSITLSGNCGQIWTLRVNAYDETATNILNTYDIVTSIPASVYHQVNIARELGQTATGGTVPATTTFRLPQRAISFRAFNTTATPSTCTMRAVVNYTY
jgi:hypothetical protein